MFATKASMGNEGKSKIPGMAPAATVFKAPNQTQSSKKKKMKEEKAPDTAVVMVTEAIKDIKITPEPNTVVDKEKRLKNLRKKLREIEDLLVKKETVELSPEQMEKVNRKDEIVTEITSLEA